MLHLFQQKKKCFFFQLNNVLFLQFWFWPDCHPRERGFGVQLSLWQWLSEVSFILCLHGVQDGRLNCVWAPLWQVWSCQDYDGRCNLCDNFWRCHLFCSKYAGFHHFAWLYRICSHRIVFMWVSTSMYIIFECWVIYLLSKFLKHKMPNCTL